VKVLVDTSVWSLALRRPKSATTHAPPADVNELKRLIGLDAAATIGPIRQELLSGIREMRQFEKLREKLSTFPDLPITREDYEIAASFFNRCRAKGIQGSNTDYLICAIAARLDLRIYSLDRDFLSFASILPIQLHKRPDGSVQPVH
jgi:predicted nucleic acid-binding protein